MLSYKQGILQFHPPLTLAETASIFGEMIVFRDLLAKAPSDEDRLAMLMGKIDDIINSVVRQCGTLHFNSRMGNQYDASCFVSQGSTRSRKRCTPAAPRVPSPRTR